MVKDFLVRAQRRRRPDKKPTVSAAQPGDQSHGEVESLGDEPALNTVVEDKPSYIDLERAETADPTTAEEASKSLKLVNVVLSDMMMNTSGVTFKDHVGSMDLCYAALQFASDTLKPGGHFVCKFYQGAEDKELEKQLRKLFAKVFRDKPESSRKDSKEGYFVGLNRKATVHLGDSSDEPST
ncbi:ribosomal RNA methyltransferase MRM2 [Verticillium dahliae VdLs.17]|uniref:rRNA methyltransferase 2, mitochondrial n=1 Tax=Verticillium dahliae (strain VdLs.17 / ATCC MYA-4575 / FGSC 10137) TaxID=498257 RepID=G2X953_VERDV|nr:ribosomal RNA methyltransferase MRM2 [Verticillium dahliae VdLs.17]EGY15521.1 ribosomal RNA methyltransferase MRM2 [Verticillium dahliae VdLs.17]